MNDVELGDRLSSALDEYTQHVPLPNRNKPVFALFAEQHSIESTPTHAGMNRQWTANPPLHRRATLATVLVAVIVVVGVLVGVIYGPRSTPPSSSLMRSPSSVSATWRGPFVDTRFFPSPTPINSVVAWKGHLFAVGGSSETEWVSTNGTTWARHPLNITGTAGSSGQLLPTPEGLLLLQSGAGGAGEADSGPPYEDLTSVWKSSDGTTWTRESIPIAMEQSGLGPGAAGQGIVIAPTYNLYTRQPGVWVAKGSGGWTFHPAFGNGAGVFGFSTGASRSGFIAAGGAMLGTVLCPAVWTSSNGVNWKRTILSTNPGGVDAVQSIGTSFTAIGHLGAGSVAWTSTAGVGWTRAKIIGMVASTAEALVTTGVGFVAVSDHVSSLFWSKIGRSWARVTNIGNAPLSISVIDAAVVFRDRLVVFVQPPAAPRAPIDNRPLQTWIVTLSG